MIEMQEPSVETIAIDNLDEFVRILSAWHTDKCQMVQRLLEVPEGTAFTIDEDDLVLEGQALAGFKFGIEMVMMQLGELPFVTEFEQEAEPAEATAG